MTDHSHVTYRSEMSFSYIIVRFIFIRYLLPLTIVEMTISRRGKSTMQTSRIYPTSWKSIVDLNN